MTLKEALRYRQLIESAAAYMPDEIAVESVVLFPAWEQDMLYEAGQRVNYCGELYRCLNNHTAQPTWTPKEAPSLWAKVLVVDGAILDWKQPGSTNPYMKGDKVSYNERTWVSDIDGNVWAPGAYGWSPC